LITPPFPIAPCIAFTFCLAELRGDLIIACAQARQFLTITPIAAGMFGPLLNIFNRVLEIFFLVVVDQTHVAISPDPAFELIGTVIVA
jgi:hypothetical protein